MSELSNIDRLLAFATVAALLVIAWCGGYYTGAADQEARQVAASGECRADQTAVQVVKTGQIVCFSGSARARR